MIIEEIDESLFISRFEDYNRVNKENGKGGNFTYKGLRALFQYLEETTDEENPLKLDIIALCCDFSEYKNLDEYLNDYYTTDEINEKLEEIRNDNNIKDEDEEREILKGIIEEEISEKTTIIKFDDDLDEGFIIQQY